MADVTFEKFGGLNLVADPQEAGAEQALSILNFALDRNGRGRTRDGYDTAYTVGADEDYVTAVFPVATNTVLIATPANKVRDVDLSAGTSGANVALSGASSSFATTVSAVYFTDGTNAQVRKYVPATGTFSSPAGLAAYEGNYLAVQPLDDRLVIADANSTSKLWFSDAATPETINASNFVELTPGDGEPITGMEVFGTELFVFKKTKFFVFYGNSTDATGGSIFNYRMVDLGIGVDAWNSYKLTAAHETGVYFVGLDGVYRTTGGAPAPVSGPITPVFKGANLPITGPFSSVLSSPRSAWWNLGIAADKLYLTTLIATPMQFVMDLHTGEWTVSDLPVLSVADGSAIASSDDLDTPGFRGAAIFGGQLASNSHSVVLKSSRAFTDDDGTAISWHHQSGFYDLGSQNSKRTRQTVLWGSGSPTVSVFTDHGSSDSNAAAVTLGTAPAVARGWHRKAYRGVLFSHKLSGSSAATVHRIGHVVADERQGR